MTQSWVNLTSCFGSNLQKADRFPGHVIVDMEWGLGPDGPFAGSLNYLSHRSSGPQYELICIQPIRDRAYSFAYSQSTAGDSTLGIN